ncbi:MAG: SDR family NAD(P)-dependent oxidoreductase, partial [Chitinophagales bacterium]
VTAAIVASEGSLDLAVNNAGIGGKLAPLHELPLEDWNKMMAINLSGVFYCMQAQIKVMLAQGGGRMVNVSSLAGVGGMGMGSSYSAAKHGVIGLSKSAAIEYGKYNIRVNVVCPGFTETAIIEQVPDKVLEFSVKTRVPLKRLGKPEEIAKGIAWLLSEESSFVNGHSMFLDGGMKAG